MISYLAGRLLRKNREDQKIVVDVNGVGYEVLLPYFVRRAFDDKETGDPVELEIYYHVAERQPRPLLIGFLRENERAFFERLLSVSDIGPMRAARALIFSVSAVAQAIEDGDVQFLTKMPEVGERTAQKIVATLRGKVAEWALLKDEGYASTPAREPDLRREALDVLVGLGYKRGEAREEVEQAFKRAPGVKNVEELIREVFKGGRSL
ncbi:MAG: Holliday junction branch migration protein RuvA [Dehalococcoidia bacterium]|nr:Holliday junction branch migration protein RuvA [Dehalococcoidia bacterium]